MRRYRSRQDAAPREVLARLDITGRVAALRGRGLHGRQRRCGGDPRVRAPRLRSDRVVADGRSAASQAVAPSVDVEEQLGGCDLHGHRPRREAGTVWASRPANIPVRMPSATSWTSSPPQGPTAVAPSRRPLLVARPGDNVCRAYVLGVSARSSRRSSWRPGNAPATRPISLPSAANTTRVGMLRSPSRSATPRQASMSQLANRTRSS